jgi:hypothetical protein
LSRGGSKGAAVDPVTRALNYLSVSSVGAFDPEQEGGCNRRWYYRYVERKPEPQTAAQAEGVRGHSEIEHYLKTGDDVLGPIARAGKLFVPEPGPGLHVEDEFAPGELTAQGVPFVGYVDLRNMRGRYLDASGFLKEAPGQVEVCDWKFTGNLRYAKPAHALMRTIQMPGYAERELRLDPNITGVRLSHVYFATKGRPDAVKSTIAVTPDAVRERWSEVEQLVGQMVDVAKESDASRVPSNLKSCRAFNRPCPHAAYCPKSGSDALVSIFGKGKAMDLMSELFGTPSTPKVEPAPVAAPAPAPPTTPAEGLGALLGNAGVAPAVASEMERLKAAEAVKLEGAARAEYEAKAHVTTPGPHHYVHPDELARLGLAAQAHQGITPPDAPAPTAEQIADAVPLEQRSGLAGALRLSADAHADAVEAPKAAEPPAEPKRKRGRPSKAEQEARKVGEPVTDTQAAPAGLVVTDSAPVQVPPDAPAGRQYSAPDGGLHVFADVDLAVLPPQMRGMIEPLENYLENVSRKLCEAAGIPDLRCAPSDNPLGFGKWKGALAGAIRAVPPESGWYTLSWVAEDERKQVLLDTLRPLATMLVRGVR